MEVRLNKIDVMMLYKMFEQGILNLNINKERVNSLNVFPVPDGDTGTNMSMTVTSAFEEVKKADPKSIPELTKLMSKGCLMSARGNSGVILSQIFRGFADASQNVEQYDVEAMANAFVEAAKVAYKAVLKPVEGTILTVIKEMAIKSKSIAKKTKTFEDFFEQLIKSGNEALQNTPNLLPILKDAGVVDSGAQGLMYIIIGFENALKGKELDADQILSNTDEFLHDDHSIIDPESITFTYCTEFIVRLHDINRLPTQEALLKMGDSLVYVPYDDVLKVHIHTDHPGSVYEMALEYGVLLKTKIENMREQNADFNKKKSEQTNKSAVHAPKTKSKKKYGFICVSSGEGIKHIFEDMKVDQIIEGGQTMNPSTKDISDAISHINAEHIFVFPNNSNIILAATQAAQLSDLDVRVIPTKSIIHGINCVINFNADDDVETNVANMTEAISAVSSIQITKSIRDTEINGVDIKSDDYLGIVNGEIKYSEADIEESVLKSVSYAVEQSEDTFLVSMYYGSDIQKEEAERLCKKLQETYPDIEIECYNGGQPVYYYYISVE